jgi:prepilin-type N-terminal cleavage/methylation domain-containing protein
MNYLIYVAVMTHCPQHASLRSGFTLVELSIVLVIIGLIVGGIFVGQDLIHAATIRAQVSQIEKYNAAVNTFRLRFNCLPGDCPATQAISFGLLARTGALGDGDGNGILTTPYGVYGIYACGEQLTFWADLSSANLIDGSFSGGCPGVITLPSQLVPSAKLGGNKVIAIGQYTDTRDYFFIDSNVTGLGSGNYLYGGSYRGVTPQDAFAMDSKVDDGLPDSGSVLSAAIVSGSGILGSEAEGAASAGNCGNTDTTPTSYNTGRSFATTPLCLLGFRIIH